MWEKTLQVCEDLSQVVPLMLFIPSRIDGRRHENTGKAEPVAGKAIAGAAAVAPVCEPEPESFWPRASEIRISQKLRLTQLRGWRRNIFTTMQLNINFG